MPSTTKQTAHTDLNKWNFGLRNTAQITAFAIILLLPPIHSHAKQIGGWEQTIADIQGNSGGSIITKSIDVHEVFSLTNKASKTRFELMIACSYNSLEILVSHSKPFFLGPAALDIYNRFQSHFDKIYRIPVYLDDQPGRIFKFYENVIQTGIGLWGREQSEPFIEKIIHAKKMRIMSLLPRVTPTFIDFDITGIKEAIAPLLKSCEVEQ